ncbi:peptidoglycan bridge formation glycyltransferase FemA/FemB family protein [Streptomyces sp. DSM 44917]|uniref:Peptidoglycan bridge formation glycyltransferase FemA/FemB family protein n=1 Tax=Streptomyces boetiae TaxID=3075541 RepID=A0ABU2L628_9ACTN|nr:peptidoglycan bridge formation glycyltransferase FemA/FemB family protein [Streptomyces sp. DSM 44917]MDT0306975.1 peptidoglycan bridge formation glycyltransferase FemA/FemB family protein [Streptomyces sp. DSM 44917]
MPGTTTPPAPPRGEPHATRPPAAPTAPAAPAQRTAQAATPRLVGLTPAEHLAFLRGCRDRSDAGLGHVSFLQTPAWARVKPGWRAESLGWREGERLVGAALVLRRELPGLRRSFAYLPEGPVIDWASPGLADRLAPLLAHLADRGVFAVRMGPPLAYRRWSARTLKAAVGPGRRVTDVLADRVEPLGAAVSEQLRAAGWQRCAEEGGGDAQPRLVVEVPLAGRSPEDLWAGLNQEWRRNVKRAGRAGVETAETGAADLPAFHRLLGVTERRDGFRLGRTLEYYQRQYAALNEDRPGAMRLFTARWNGEVLAAHTLLHSADGARAWYQTGASSDHLREVRPSNALQWRLLREAHARGASVYDMRGVPQTLDPDERPFGLLRWKLGTGGEVVELAGEWELRLDGAVNRALHRAVRGYLARR